jgi:D-lactate dehydrogenase (cytochrome)
MDPSDAGRARQGGAPEREDGAARHRLEGTCTGEHGIGLHKMGYLVDEAGAGAVDDDAPASSARSTRRTS